jgi:glyoxylase-like metal-dependent hydrolase (beta-lactamase superfamily II)
VVAADDVREEVVGKLDARHLPGELCPFGLDQRDSTFPITRPELTDFGERQARALTDLDHPGLTDRLVVVHAVSRTQPGRTQQANVLPVPEHVRGHSKHCCCVADALFTHRHISPLYFRSTLSYSFAHMTEHVQSPSLAACCGALVGLAVGAVRPRRADRRFLASLNDAGLPKASTTVRVTTLKQVPQSVPTGLVVEGRRRPRRIDNSLASFVVTHPEATFIVDPSICVDAETRAVAQLPTFLRVAVSPPRDVVPTVTALEEAAVELDFALPTHAHWDHVCGLLDLPNLPVHLHARERDWVMTGAAAPVGGVRDSLRDRPTVAYDLDGPPVLTFTSSHDLFGDGSVVLVDLAGHTPGSVGVLLHTPECWILLAGDAAWHTYQIEDIRQKSSYPGGIADVDRDGAFRTLHRLHAVRDRITVVPTHDPQAAQSLRAS